MANKMLIDAAHPEETRVVVLRGNRVEEFDFETAQRKQLRGNIYLAKVTRVEPSLQAAFVEYGGNRHGFLAFSEIHPDYYQIPVADRQALIDADQRAQRDFDSEEDERGGRGHGRRRGRDHRRRREPDDSVRSDPVSNSEEQLAAEEMAREAAEIPAGENMLGDPLPEPSTTETPPQAEAAPGPHAETEQHPSEPVGETANPPVTAEIGTEMVEPASSRLPSKPVRPRRRATMARFPRRLTTSPTAAAPRKRKRSSNPSVAPTRWKKCRTARRAIGGPTRFKR